MNKTITELLNCESLMEARDKITILILQRNLLLETLKGTWCSSIEDNHAIGDNTPEANKCPICENARSIIKQVEEGKC